MKRLRETLAAAFHSTAERTTQGHEWKTNLHPSKLPKCDIYSQKLENFPVSTVMAQDFPRGLVGGSGTRTDVCMGGGVGTTLAQCPAEGIE